MLEHQHSYLPVFQSPYIDPEELSRNSTHDSGNNSGSGHGSGHSRHESHASFIPQPTFDVNGKIKRPAFRRFHQATNLELFYDLFFVANLTVFTYVHEVNDGDSLKQYVGFFSILWFTWYQVSLYDVRFAMDSVFERVAKALHFMIMIGFAIIGPQFNPGEEQHGDGDKDTPNFGYFKGLTIGILMASRLILVAQYLQALWFAKDYKKMVLPMSVIAGTYFVAAMLYLGLFWTFTPSLGENHSYIAWYVVGIFETILVFVVSFTWKSLNFVGTHLHERMQLLTLIILGEGAIATAKACQYIVFAEGTFSFTGSVAGTIICAILNIYFLYMLYFDWIAEEHFGQFRLQIWSVLHFPLHVALVLAVEGASQCITWNAGVVRGRQLLNQVDELSVTLHHESDPNQEEWDSAATSLNETSTEILHRALDRSSSFLSTLQGSGYYYQTAVSVVPTIQNGTEDAVAASNAIWWLTGVLYSSVFKIAGFYPPETIAAEEQALTYLEKPIDFAAYPHDSWYNSAITNIGSAAEVFALVFTYFFIATGVFVMLSAVLASLNRGRKTRFFWIRLVFQFLVGVGLSLVSVITTSAVPTADYLLSPWMLPTITICLFLVVVLNSVKLSKKREDIEGHGHHEEKP